MAENSVREALKEVVVNLRLSKHLNKDAALNLIDRAIDNFLPAGAEESAGCKDCKACRTGNTARERTETDGV